MSKKSKYSSSAKNHYQKNKIKILENRKPYAKLYREKNREAIRIKSKKYNELTTLKYKKDPTFRKKYLDRKKLWLQNNPNLKRKFRDLDNTKKREKYKNDPVEALLPSMYVDLMAGRMACAILKNLDMGKTSSDEQKNLNRKILEIENECQIYDEIYNRYFYMYTEAVKAQKISNFYYFESKSSESDSSATIGMFPTMSECKEYNDLFKEKEIALVRKCKTYYK